MLTYIFELLLQVQDYMHVYMKENDCLYVLDLVNWDLDVGLSNPWVLIFIGQDYKQINKYITVSFVSFVILLWFGSSH